VGNHGFVANSEQRIANSGISAFVLAGGRSSRMGVDKALLRLGERSLLERALEMVSALASCSYIVGLKARYSSFGETIEDIYPGCGPLSGIHAALTATSTDLNLILSVDMPLMTPEFLRWLIEKSRASEEWIVLPEIAGGPQPLCAIYRRRVAAVAGEVLRAGDYKVARLFDRVSTRIVTEPEIFAAGFSPEIFRNINTPEEYAQCRP
jgi:molybdopterin-guanine dinucleotide biosynthesis protein A